MLIKIFEVDESIRGEDLAELIKQSVSKLGFDSEQIRVGFSRAHLFGGVNPIRMVVTGLDAFGMERRIVSATGEACRRYYEQSSVRFPGLSNPALPNQK